MFSTNSLRETNNGIGSLVRRDRTVERILDLVEQQRTVIIRSASFTGKSTLAALLEDYVLRNHGNEFSTCYGIEPIRIACSKKPRAYSFADYYRHLFNTDFAHTLCSQRRLMLIIDDAQELYAEENNSLWKLIKQRSHCLSFVIFSSYDNLADMRIVLPTDFSMDLLRYTSREFAEYARVSLSALKFESDETSTKALRHLSNLTRNHPGLLDSVARFANRELKISSSDPLDVNRFIQLLSSSHFYNHMLENSRALTSIIQMNLFDFYSISRLNERNEIELDEHSIDLVWKGVLEEMSSSRKTLRFSSQLIVDLIFHFATKNFSNQLL